ncbi:MAG: hypothetical protein V1835_03270 [Candidatus Micrarchaeota archaeon]
MVAIMGKVSAHLKSLGFRNLKIKGMRIFVPWDDPGWEKFQGKDPIGDALGKEIERFLKNSDYGIEVLQKERIDNYAEDPSKYPNQNTNERVLLGFDLLIKRK